MSYSEHNFDFILMHTFNINKKQIDMEIIERYSFEQKINLIEFLSKSGYLPWSKEEVTREINENCRMVRILGGPYPYLWEWIKMGLENAFHGRRVWDGETFSVADKA